MAVSLVWASSSCPPGSHNFPFFMPGCCYLFIAVIIAEFFIAICVGVAIDIENGPVFFFVLPDLHTKILSPSLSSIVLMDPLFGA